MMQKDSSSQKDYWQQLETDNMFTDDVEISYSTENDKISNSLLCHGLVKEKQTGCCRGKSETNYLLNSAQSAEAREYADCISAEG